MVSNRRRAIGRLFLLQAEIAGELLLPWADLMDSGRGADIPCGNVVALKFLGVVAEGDGGSLAGLVVAIRAVCGRHAHPPSSIMRRFR